MLIPKYVLSAINTLVKPFLKKELDLTLLENSLLHAGKSDTATLSEIAELFYISRDCARIRLRKAGVKPSAHNGGKTGRESVYLLSAVFEAFKQGAAEA